jgi:hypothetical protein
MCQIVNFRFNPEMDPEIEHEFNYYQYQKKHQDHEYQW